MTSPVALPSMRQPAGRLRADLAVACWLKRKDLGDTSHPLAAGMAACGYVLATGALLAGAAYLHEVAPPSAPIIGVILGPLWWLWALLPVIGGGGGVVESSAALAPYPVRSRVHLLSAWLSAVLDLRYAVPVPAVAAALVAGFGPTALLPAAALVLGASAFGQLLAWGVGGGLRPTRGVGAICSALVVVLGAAVFLAHGRLTPASVVATPTSWLLSACRAGDSGLWLPWLGWSALTSLPALVLAAVGTKLVGRAMVARASGRAAREPRASAGLPSSPLAALVSAASRGVLRSVAFRAATLMALATPFVAAALLPHVSAAGVVCMTLVSGGSTLAANAWAFDAGGVVLWLSAPVSRAGLVAARTVAVAVSLLLLLVAAAVGASLAGVSLAGAGTAGFTALLLALVTCAGLRTGTRHPSMADFDSLRGRQTTSWVALTYTLHAGLGAIALISLWAVPGRGPWLAAGAAALYCLWALRAATRELRDGATITAAFASAG